MKTTSYYPVLMTDDVAGTGAFYIDNFRCFSNFEFRPARVNLLFGRNGSGKTSLFEVVRSILRVMLAGTPITLSFGPRDLTRWDSRLEQQFELDVRLDESLYTYTVRIGHDADHRRCWIIEEVVRCEDRTLFAFHDGRVRLHDNDGQEGTHFPFRGDRSFLPQMEASPDNRDLMRLLDYLRGTRVLKLLPPQIGGTSSGEDLGLDVDGHNFASWYRHQSQERPAQLHRLFDDLRLAIPGFRSLALMGSGQSGRTRELVVTLDAPDGGDYAVEFTSLSDGQRALAVLYTLLVDLEAEPGLVLLDEPENFVGLLELKPWLGRLDDVLGDGGQLMLISHHPEVIDTLAADHAVMFAREGGGPVRIRTKDLFDRETGLKASEQILRGFVDDA